MSRATGIGAALALLAALSLAGCSPRTPSHESAGHAEEGAAPHDAHPEPGAHDEHAEPSVVELSTAAVGNAGLEFGVAGPASIATVVETPGEIHLNSERVLEVRPRYPGVVRQVRKRIGDPVRAGEVVAVVQSNESLTDYEITSSMSGTVIARPVVDGQSVDHDARLLTVADLGTVWADFAIYPQHVGRVRVGMPVSIVAAHRPGLIARGTIRYVGPLLEQDTRVSSARVVLGNAGGEWQPGLFITARVELDRSRVPVAVPEEALVRTLEGPAVFTAAGLRFTLTPVATGRSDGRLTEIVRGLAAGDSIVTANAFVLKSELAKGEVAHEH